MALKDYYPLFIFGILAAWIGSICFWNVVRNTSRKKQLMEEYEQEGVDVAATVVKQEITSHRLFVCVETGTTYHLVYAYQAEGLACFKEYWHSTNMRPRCCSPLVPFPSSFPVRVLPGFPRSGVPKFRVLDRESEFGFASCMNQMAQSLFVMILGIASIVASFSPISNTLELVAIVVVALGFFLFEGLAFSNCLFQRWKGRMLASGKWARCSDNQRGEGSTIPMVVAGEVGPSVDESIPGMDCELLEVSELEEVV